MVSGLKYFFFSFACNIFQEENIYCFHDLSFNIYQLKLSSKLQELYSSIYSKFVSSIVLGNTSENINKEKT